MEIKKSNLYRGPRGAILGRFSNLVWKISLFPQVNHGEIKPLRSSRRRWLHHHRVFLQPSRLGRFLLPNFRPPRTLGSCDSPPADRFSVYLDLKTKDYGRFVNQADRLLRSKLDLPAGYTHRWAGEYEFELRAKRRLTIILPIVLFVIFLLLYMVFKSAAEAAVLIFPTLYVMSGGLILQWVLGYNFGVAVWVGYIALFGIAVETGVVMVVYLHEALQHRLAMGTPLTDGDVEQAKQFRQACPRLLGERRGG